MADRTEALLLEIRDMLVRFAGKYLGDENEEGVSRHLPRDHPTFMGDAARHNPDTDVAAALAQRVPLSCEHQWVEALRPNSGEFARFCTRCRAWAPIQ